MHQNGELACFGIAGSENQSEALLVLAILDLLRGLQREAELAGLRVSAALIAVAAQAALEEGVQLGRPLAN